MTSSSHSISSGFFEEFSGAPIPAVVEGKIRLLQNRKDILRERLAPAGVTAEGAAH